VGRSIAEVLADAGESGDPAQALHLTAPPHAPVTWTFARGEQLPVHVEVTWRQVDPRRRQLMLRDVSERVRAEEARHDIEVQLAHAQRLEAVGQLAGGIAHDFNNLLMTISGSADLLRSETDPDERTLLLDEVTAAQERGAALTRQLLAFARREVVRPIVLDLSALVAERQRVLQRVTGEVVKIFADLEPGCQVRGDVGQLEQVLVNLVSNARDAMPNGGTCAIHVGSVVHDDGIRWVQLRVVDTGVGMEPAVAARVFEPFFTTKPRGRGTGLGLASVHGIVMQSGGHVAVESTPGRGTTVALSFPFIDAPLEPKADRTSREMDTIADRDAASSRGRILVAEDDDSTRAVVGRILQRAGYHVQLVPDGMQALRRIESDPQSIDLLITDVMMPGLTGPQLVQRARERVPSLRVIYLSGYPEDATTAAGGLPLGQAFLAKPFSGNELMRLVADQLGVEPAAGPRPG
jgi:signal transduction histidine kinase/CheY-like chemotaxis protein